MIETKLILGYHIPRRMDIVVRQLERGLGAYRGWVAHFRPARLVGGRGRDSQRGIEKGLG